MSAARNADHDAAQEAVIEFGEVAPEPDLLAREKGAQPGGNDMLWNQRC